LPLNGKKPPDPETSSSQQISPRPPFILRGKWDCVPYFFLRAIYVQIPIPPNNTTEVTTNIIIAEVGIILSF
jgi:hypothetical protein